MYHFHKYFVLSSLPLNVRDSKIKTLIDSINAPTQNDVSFDCKYTKRQTIIPVVFQNHVNAMTMHPTLPV